MWAKLTDGGDNLRLHAELVLETASKVADATLAITSNVGDLSDVVEHVAAGEEKHHDQAEGSPQIAVLDDGQNVGGGDGDEGDEAEDSSGHGDNLDVVDGADNRRVRALGEVARDPGVDAVGGLAARQVISRVASVIRVQLQTYPEAKSKRLGWMSVRALMPEVG